MAEIIHAQPVIEGAGVRLKRILSEETAEDADPFLLLDHFGSDDPADYIKGFPWHPHRGIETVTYMLEGRVEHEDSLGNKGVINAGDVQWMTAGGGILHQEMPKVTKRMQGFQLWVNLPQKHKMMAPLYRSITKEQIPVIRQDGLELKLIAGTFAGKTGPVKDLVVDVEYFDVSIERSFTYNAKQGYNTFCYVFEGEGSFAGDRVSTGQLILFRNQVSIDVKGKVRFILVSGKPINEPIAWGGPIVMNTEAELQKAFAELEDGKFIKK